MSFSRQSVVILFAIGAAVSIGLYVAGSSAAGSKTSGFVPTEINDPCMLAESKGEPCPGKEGAAVEELRETGDLTPVR